MTGRRRYLISHGPRSGRGTAARKTILAVSRLQARGHEVEVVENHSVEQARQTFARAVDTAADVLVVAGGDGLVGMAAGACAGTGTALSIIPAGTGNDAARSLRIPLATPAAVEVLLADRRRQMDLIQVTPAPAPQDTPQHPSRPDVRSGHQPRRESRVVLGSVPVGIDARIAARATTLPKWWGAGVYAGAVIPELPRLRPQPYRIRAGTGGTAAEHEVEALIVAVCNLAVYGGGMRIAPQADPTDGLLDLVLITGVGPRQALGLLHGVFTGAHIEHPSVQVHRASTFRIEGPAHTAYGDGEAIGPLPVQVSSLPRALTVLV